MSDVLIKCTVCGAVLDEEDLFCSNCGTEAPTSCRASRTVASSTRLSTHNFECQGCGASMSYDASAQALRCPFCGSEKLKEQADAKEIAPQAVVPFQVPRDEAEALLRAVAWAGLLAAGRSGQAGRGGQDAAVYVPYWVFEANDAHLLDGRHQPDAARCPRRLVSALRRAPRRSTPTCWSAPAAR